MNNVYEIELTREVRKIESFTEIVELCNETEQSRETLDKYIQKKYGDGLDGVLVNMSSKPTKMKPEKYFVDNIKYEPSILEVKTEHTDYFKINKGDYYYDFVIEGLENEPLLDDLLTFPENTESIIGFHSHQHIINSKTLLPCNSLLFYFSIKKEKVVDLWKSGNIKELKKYNIIPTEPKHRNLVYNYGAFGKTFIHPNHPILIDDIYKRRNSKNMHFIAVFTCDELNRTDFSVLMHTPKFCINYDTERSYQLFVKDTREYDPITNDLEKYEPMIDEDGEEGLYRVGTYKPSIDDKGKMFRYKNNEKLIINYDTDKLKTYFEERNAREREEDEKGGV